MNFSIATLLANFSEDKLVTPKAVEKKLDCLDDQSVRQFQIVLDALERIGLLEKDKGRYRRLPLEGVVEAKLRCSSKGFCFAIQDTEGSEDVYIRESHLSNAWNGDRVLVKIIKEGSRRRSPEGEVELILERSNPSVLARVKQLIDSDGNISYRAMPLDDRLLFEVDLITEGDELAEAIDYLVHVEISRYPLANRRPVGRVVQILGLDAEAANDLDIVCCKHDLPRSFSEALQEQGKAISNRIYKADSKNRLDLRDSLLISFGEADKQDINHAFSIETLKGGNFQVGIHITDVAHYIEPDSSLDKEARKRGISVYLGEILIPIFPEIVSCDRVALTTEHDRMAFSILININKSGQIVDFEMHRSVVRVSHHFTYDQAEYLLASKLGERDTSKGEEGLGKIPKTVTSALEHLLVASHAVRSARLRRGAFELNLPEFNNFYDDEGELGAMIVPDLSPVQAMISELLVLTNQAIASHLQALAVPGIYRVQGQPDLADVQEFLKLSGNLGVDLALGDEDEIQSVDFHNFAEAIAQSKSERVLNYLLEDTLKPATYSCTPKPHFGLALAHGYTHCTSPLSRYSDLLMLRVLHIILDQGRDRRTSRAKEGIELNSSSSHGKVNWNVLPTEVQHELESQLTAVVVHLTERENVAQEAQDDLEGLKKTGLMKEVLGQTFQGLITGVQSYGFFVEIEIKPANGEKILRVEGLVHVSSLKDDWYEYRSRQQTLVGRKNRNQYRLGDFVQVQVKSVDYYRQQIDLMAISNINDDDDRGAGNYRF
ncbi:MAG: ribonuclease R family protein [Microcoleaceae cyanobacterium]